MSTLNDGFGNGAIGAKEWRTVDTFMLDKGLARVVEIGSGFSTYLFSMRCDLVVTMDTCKKWLEHAHELTEPRDNTIPVLYMYPELEAPYNNALREHGLTHKLPAAETLWFVDGPAGHTTPNADSRAGSMRFAAAHARFVGVHDASRAGEAANIAEIFPERHWKRLVPGNLSLLERL